VWVTAAEWASIANSTIRLYSAIHVDSCWKIQDKGRIKNTETKHNPEKQTTQNTANQNYPGLVASYDTRP